MFKFEELRVYQEAVQLASNIYSQTKSWPKEEIFGLTNQLRRAGVSISLNIAEGSSRTQKDFCHFLDLSRGSCYECVAIITIAKKQNYLDGELFSTMYDKCESLSKMLSALKNSLK